MDMEIPLYAKLMEIDSNNASAASATERSLKGKRRYKSPYESDNENAIVGRDNESTDNDDHHAAKKKIHKNAPAEMKSNRPVRRLRVTADNSVRKFRDPRFSDASGKLNHNIFMKSYSFLEEYQEDEIKKLEQASKRVKSEHDKATLLEELSRRKQELKERRRTQNVQKRLNEVKAIEKDKIKNGKKPFFLKKTAVKEIALEERYNELKSEGKLQKYLAKKRKKNANKDHRWLPSGRRDG